MYMLEKKRVSILVHLIGKAYFNIFYIFHMLGQVKKNMCGSGYPTLPTLTFYPLP